MITENVNSLQIHKLSQAQYNAALAAGTLNENALYLTPDGEAVLTIANIDGLQDALDSLEANSSSLLDAYPVGSVYISYVSTSPASLFGGTWTAITGVFPYFNAGTGTGGSNTHTLTVAEMPAHTHSVSNSNWSTTSGDSSSGKYIVCTSEKKTVSTVPSLTSGSAGSGSSHNNMPAYQTFYAWRRTA